MPPKQGSRKIVSSKLAPIAPSTASSSEQSPSTTTFADVPRTRLPPRSRNGCWTCRLRKVKCDEGRPRCQQCIRLGHQCDYSPKLAFKDETPKIIDKYTGPSNMNPAWSRARVASGLGTPPATEDSLPPFTSLSTEEDWQRKAEHKPPGTYYVVANDKSFSEIEEYRQTANSSPRSSATSANRAEIKSNNRPSNLSIDPETIILGSFEENPRWPNILPSTSAVRSDSEGSHAALTSPLSANLAGGFDRLRVSPDPLEHLPSAFALDSNEQLRLRLQYQYRTVVRWHILQNFSLLPDIAGQVEDAIEREARNYIPLAHAFRAIAALSLSRQDSSQSVNALQYYQQALQALKVEQDLASNGSFLTHFILLIYEIAQAEPFWPYHMDSLHSIVMLRRQNLQPEPFPYVIWWICLIDLNALLSGSGEGALFLSLIHNELVPTGFEMTESPSFFGSASRLHEDRDRLTSAWVLLREVSIAAARIGEVALHLRNPSSAMPPTQIEDTQQQILTMIETLHNAWKLGWSPSLAIAVKEGRLPEEAYAVFSHARLTYHMCIIFIHTSLLPTQQGFLLAEYRSPIFDSAMGIVEIVEEALQTRRLERRFCILPLLIAGTVLYSPEQQMSIRGMLASFNRTTLGSNTRATAKLYETICERQRQGQELASPAISLDLMSITKQLESRHVNFGL